MSEPQMVKLDTVHMEQLRGCQYGFCHMIPVAVVQMVDHAPLSDPEKIDVRSFRIPFSIAFVSAAYENPVGAKTETRALPEQPVRVRKSHRVVPHIITHALDQDKKIGKTGSHEQFKIIIFIPSDAEIVIIKPDSKHSHHLLNCTSCFLHNGIYISPSLQYL